MTRKIDYFFVGQDVQIQIDEKNPEWYDEYGNLLIEYVEAFLHNNEFINDHTTVWRDTTDHTLYEFNNDNIQCLKRTGIGKMYRIS